MIPDNYEAFYFEEDEFGNNNNLKDVLDGLGEQTDGSLPIQSLALKILGEFGFEAEDVLSRDFYQLEGGSQAGFYQLEDGVVIGCNSSYLSENSRSISSRSSNKI